MKINDRSGKIGGIFDQHSSDEKKKVESNGALFQRSLEGAQHASEEAEIQNLRNRLDVQGERLRNRMDIHELRFYKKLLADYLQQLLGGAYQFQKENLPDRKGRFRMFGLVKKINSRLEELTEEVLKEEKDRVAIIQMLDDIRGMLIDLTL